MVLLGGCAGGGACRPQAGSAARAHEVAPFNACPACVALDVVKRSYSLFLGGMLASSRKHANLNRSKLCRPDWRDMVRGEAMFKMWRALAFTSPAPALVVDPDAAYFLTSGPGVVPAGLTVSKQAGKFKIHRVCPAAEVRAAIGAGTVPVRIRSMIARGDEAYRAGGGR